ncbi:MAG: PIG-L family deacetylase [Spirochaetaceae bacterium]|jgi:LmbE family N-acetylglucosaminyl deacetylase|nr:PIG-L family deacetylase [Spirochaetaceae bacterium]
MKVLFVSAHPDDIEINCAGTAKRMVDRGDEVVLCNLCNGDMGHVVIPSEKLKEMRLKESRASAAFIGAKYMTLNTGDLRLYHQHEATRDAVIDIIRKVNPELIITHSPNDYMPDHIAVSKLVFDASFCASLPHYASKESAVVPICPIYYMDNLGAFGFSPTEYVDISGVMDVKLAMLRCHQTQLTWLKDHDHIDFEETVTVFSRMRGLQAGVKYAEGFVQMAGWGRMTTKRLLP